MNNKGAHNDPPLRVLGISLVVEEVGKEAELIFRYPVAPPKTLQTNSYVNGDSASSVPPTRLSSKARGVPENTKEKQKQRHDSNTSETSSLDLFFSLPPKVMVKLFRTKSTLVDQPMTLSIGGTMFCCRSIMLNKTAQVPRETSSLANTQEGTESTISNSATYVEDVRLSRSFNIIVALVPIREAQDDSNETNRNKSLNIPNMRKLSNADFEKPENKSEFFPAIRRIHLSLARLCKCLQREERRCLYVSRQVSMLIKVSKDFKAERKELKKNEENRSRMDSRTASPGPKPGTSNQVALAMGISPVTDNENALTEESSWNQDEEKQELIDVLLAARIPNSQSIESNELKSRKSRRSGNNRSALPIHGNLIQDLVHTYHALSRNTMSFNPSPASLLSGNDSIVRVNHHLAVQIEPVRASGRKVFDMGMATNESKLEYLRPYHTLLFPHASRAELLRSIYSSLPATEKDYLAGDSSQRRLEKLLLVAHPFHSLKDMASFTALPYPVITDAAYSLLESGMCIAVSSMSRNTRFACQNGAAKRLPSLALKFSQRYGPTLPIFLIVSAFTCPLGKHVTLGDIIDQCRNAIMAIERPTSLGISYENGHAGLSEVFKTLARQIMTMTALESNLVPPGFKTDPILQSSDSLEHSRSGGDLNGLANGTIPRKINTMLAVEDTIIDAIISMAAWLRSHSVIVELKEYLTLNPNASKVSADIATAPSVPKLSQSTQAVKMGSSLDITNTSRSRSTSFDLKGHNRENLIRMTTDESNFSTLKEIRPHLLEGNISLTALAWKAGLSRQHIEYFRDWGCREKILKLTFRVPIEGDDWGAP
jgi:hypothetical protein